MATTTTSPAQRLQRCDRCGARAKFQILVSNDGLELLMCSHHANEHSERLLAGGYSVLPMLEI